MGGGSSGSGAAKSAAKIQAKAAEDAAALQRQDYLDSVRMSAPQLVGGESAFNQMMDILGLPRLQQRVNLPSTLPSGGGIGSTGATTAPASAIQPGGQIAITQGPRGTLQFSQLAQSAAAPTGTPALSDALTPYNPTAVPKTPWTLSLADYANDPSAQLQMQESEKGLNRMAAARGMFNSGATLKALQTNADLNWNNYYTRKSNDFSTYWGNLAGIAGVGSSTTGNLQSLGAQSAANQGSLLTQGANAQAAGIVGSAQASAAGRQSSFNNLIGLGSLGSSLFSGGGALSGLFGGGAAATAAAAAPEIVGGGALATGGFSSVPAFLALAAA